MGLGRIALIVFMTFDILTIITCSMVYFSDMASAPAPDPVYEITEPVLIEETENYRIFEIDGYRYMQTVEDGKVRTRLISSAEMHITFIPSVTPV